MPSIHSIIADWNNALAQPFDAERLRAIKDAYEAAGRRETAHHAIYELARADFAAALKGARAQAEVMLEPKSKAEVAALIGLTDPAAIRRHSKDSLIGVYQSIKVDYGVESDHERVKRVWAALTDAEKEDAAAAVSAYHRMERAAAPAAE